MLLIIVITGGIISALGLTATSVYLGHYIRKNNMFK